MKNYKIVQVKTILGIERPIVVFVTSAGVDIARTPKQALLDLQNSGRGLDLDPTLFNRGLGAVGIPQLGKFKKALFNCVGAEVSGEIRPFKAGDTFVYTEGHPALTDKSHELYGKVKLGSKGVAESDGVWVDQFLNIPQTGMERQMDLIAENVAGTFASMFGLGQIATQETTVDTYEDSAEEELVSQEAIGTGKQSK